MIDTRGLSCPTPVLLTKKAVEGSPKEIEVLVDNNTARNNVERFLKSAGYGNFIFTDKGDDETVIRAEK